MSKKLFRHIRVLAIASALVGFACGAIAYAVIGTASSSANTRSISLTQAGQLRYSLEELLYQQFGGPVASAQANSPSNEIDFNCGNCGPLATEEPFFDVFQLPKGLKSSFELRTVADSSSLYFGNYGVVVEIKGKLIQCGSTGRYPKYLVAYGDSIDLGLTCLQPQSP